MNRRARSAEPPQLWRLAFSRRRFPLGDRRSLPSRAVRVEDCGLAAGKERLRRICRPSQCASRTCCTVRLGGNKLLGSGPKKHLPGPKPLADDLYRHPLPPAPLELSAEDPFPHPAVESPFCEEHNKLPDHHLALRVRLGIVLAISVMPVLVEWLVRRQLLQPLVAIVMQSGSTGIDGETGDDVSGVGRSFTITNTSDCPRWLNCSAEQDRLSRSP